MIKSGLNIYFKSFLYVFVSLGALFLAILIAATVLFDRCVVYTRDFAESVVGLYDGVHPDVNGMITYLVNYLEQLTEWNTERLLAVIKEGTWLTDGVLQYLSEQNPGILQSGEKLNLLLAEYGNSLQRGLIGAYIIILAGVVAGFFLTKYLIRRESAKRGILKWLLNSLADSVLSATVIAFTTWILSLWSPGALITWLISGLVFGLVSLFEAYLVHGYKKIDAKEIVTEKNALALIGVDLITMSISVVIILAFLYLLNIVVALAVAYALLILTFVVIELNAEAFVVRKVQSVAQPKGGSESDKAQSACH